MMRKHIIGIGMVLLVLSSCSTTKNTGATRGYHGMKVVHNVYFNGAISYREGMDAINKANEDDYSKVLNLYPISNPKTQQAAVSQMDKSIEKARKSIKLHSIHVRPKKINAAKRRKDPKYKLWLESKEFNGQMYRAWLLLGQSEFHKGDFLGSVGTFTYIQKLYENDPDMVALCQLWIARAYGEMGWQYEAETQLGKVKVDHLKRKHQPFYSAVSADILLKGQRYREAIPFVKIAKSDETRKGYKPRFEYVLAQLYQQNDQRSAARAGYKRVISLQPEHVMRFNAELRYAELDDNISKSLKKLGKMAKRDKNKDVLDQIYGTIGNIYLTQKDTAAALEQYSLAIRHSTPNSKNKAGVLLTAGDLYYLQQQYDSAAPCYKEAVQMIENTDPRYAQAYRRSLALDELVQRTETVELQDSLQHLSTLSEKEQRKIVDEIIARLIEQEKADSVKAQADAREKELNEPLEGVNTDLMVGVPRDNSWYFYNENLLKKGRQAFVKTWGNRKLEDDWRRQSKAQAGISNFAEEAMTDGDTAGLVADSTSTATAPKVTDNHQPEYYLQQIPKTEEDFYQSDSLIAAALYDLIYIYKEQLQDYPKSVETFHELCRRFPKDERLTDLYYMQYLSALQQKDSAGAEQIRQELMRLYPNSKQAQIVSDPAYKENLERTAQMQDSLYEATYEAYRKGKYKEVKQNKLVAEKEFPLTTLMPRFLFLNAVGVARTEGQKAFVAELQDMVERYPEHELSTMAKNMLAMMDEGLKAQKGGSLSNLQEARGQTTTEDEKKNEQKFSFKRQIESHVLILFAKDEQTQNNLQYQTALFNFSQFLIKDFDIQIIPSLSDKESAVQISGFESMDEAEWYISLLEQDASISSSIREAEAQVLPITSENMKLLEVLGVEAYKQFVRR